MGRRVTFKAGTPGAEREITVEIHDDDAAPWGLGSTHTWVGKEIPRLDGAVKATGRAKYTQDIQRPKLAHAAFLGSPHAHAKVTSVDATAAKAIPGVLAVRTFEGRRLTYAGQIVAAVCAESETIADDALRALKITYEVSDAVVTVEDAEKEGAPRVDPNRANAGPENTRASRDPEGAVKDVAEGEVVVSAEFRTQIQTHSALEAHGIVAEVNPDGTATVWASTQATGSIAGGMAGPLGVPAGRIRVLTEHMGGGFGAKFGTQAWDQITAGFAKETGRPVKGLLPRRLEHLLGGNRPDSIQRLTLAGTKDGTFTALVGDVRGTPGNGTGGADTSVPRIYAFPKVKMSQRGVSTFTERGAAFRAPGHPPGIFAVEGIVDLFAAKAGLDPLEVRLKNDRHPLRQLQWRIGAERIGWEKNRRKVAGSDPGPVKRGVGCGAAVWYQKGSTGWDVDVLVAKDGTVTVSNGAQDLGTGTRTVLAILAAEELGVDPREVVVRLGDTTLPPGPGSGGSQTAPGLGPAARNAGWKARQKIEALLALEWGADAAEVKREGGVFVGPGGKKATFREACSLIGPDGLAARGHRFDNYDGFNGDTAGCQFAQVAVDVETGVVRVEKVVAVHDAGRIVNALTARSQVNGGVIQGISYALYEDRRLDRRVGDMVNPTLDTYRISGMADTPEIDVVLTSIESGFNNSGMMGLGEPATVPTAGAIACAVYNAIGVFVTELPMTPARVLAALERARSTDERRQG